MKSVKKDQIKLKSGRKNKIIKTRKVFNSNTFFVRFEFVETWISYACCSCVCKNLVVTNRPLNADSQIHDFCPGQAFFKCLPDFLIRDETDMCVTPNLRPLHPSLINTGAWTHSAGVKFLESRCVIKKSSLEKQKFTTTD